MTSDKKDTDGKVEPEDPLDFQTYFEVTEEQYEEFVRLLNQPPEPSERLMAFLNHKPPWEKWKLT
jgi:uncharacterized protein (DUF1778 family)